MRIIPAIDIINGQCVRLSKGDYQTQKTYHNQPLEMAKMFEDHGISYLHLVDLDGAKARSIVNYKVLESIASHTGLRVDFGGGLQSDEDLHIAFESGAHQVTGGSIAVKQPETFMRWLADYGPDKIILGADALHEKIAISGWQEASQEALLPFIQRYEEKGVRQVICTDISKDGMLQGPSVALYQKILAGTAHIRLVASGGISDITDLPVLAGIGCEGTIIGKAIYEDRISLQQLKEYILEHPETSK